MKDRDIFFSHPTHEDLRIWRGKVGPSLASAKKHKANRYTLPLYTLKYKHTASVCICAALAPFSLLKPTLLLLSNHYMDTSTYIMSSFISP